MFSSNTHSKVIITTQSCIYIITSTLPTAATFIQPLVNTTVCLGSTAQFVCSATNVSIIYYLVDSMTIPSVASRGVSVSATTYNGNMAIVNLTILGTLVNNNSFITCLASVSSGLTFLTSSAYLSIQGQYMCKLITTYHCCHISQTIRSSICSN